MKTYLIAGASKGIGLAIAEKLKGNGHKVINLSRTVSTIADKNYTIDFSIPNIEMPEIEGTLDGIIYCPGSINLKPFKAFKDEDFLKDFQINFLGATAIIRKYSKQLSNPETASILLFSTVAVQTGMSFHSSISAAKGAVEGLTRSLAAEFAPSIRVNCIAPSLTKTELAEKLINSDVKLKASEDRHPLKKIGEPEDLAHMAISILENKWLTGQIIHLDGGMSAIR
jgi:NAD(P)-dependent dehydrogenase (short-subunit alcohol dehydrogenase family)